MGRKILEVTELDCIVAPQDVGTADVTGTWLDCSSAHRFVVLAKAGAVTAAKVLTVQLRQATSSGGAGAKDLGTAVTSVGAGGNPPADIEIEKAMHDLDLAGGFTFVTAVLGIDENAKLGAAVMVRDKGTGGGHYRS